MGCSICTKCHSNCYNDRLCPACIKRAKAPAKLRQIKKDNNIKELALDCPFDPPYTILTPGQLEERDRRLEAYNARRAGREASLIPKSRQKRQKYRKAYRQRHNITYDGSSIEDALKTQRVYFERLAKDKKD